ncbi:hypothetical protein DEO72_LG2g1052 [Vigna unguiculata]|uniref:Uncharacterized protein n=1 Tax=Vigna unguiculata TaxID=3917 RepID=A0A4D6KVF4_VIGUN|nr:hypothetical protein DEO72_LG2g1052 [Vigna unguiculata]
MTQPHEFSYSLCSTFSFLFHCWGGVVFPDKRVWRGRLERKKLSSAVNSCNGNGGYKVRDLNVEAEKVPADDDDDDDVDWEEG